MTQGGQQGPWGSRPGGGNRGGNNGGGNRPQGPDLDDVIRKGQERIKDMLPGGSGKGIGLLILLALALWMASGIYSVAPNEEGIVLRFGKYHDRTEPGLRYHLPYPIERVLKPEVTTENHVELGFRSLGGRGTGRGIEEESLMLTGDENIIDIHFVVDWKIMDAKNFLFNIRNPDVAVKHAAESAMRGVIGKTQIAAALAEGRENIQAEAKKELQRILNSYNAGIEIVRLQLLKSDPPAAVIDAFRDVQTARADAERAKNEAEAYKNDIIPKARGQAVEMVQRAEAYKERVIAEAEGESSRFLAIHKEYKLAPAVTRKRLYLEAMEDVMEGMPKVVVDDKVGNLVPFLPLGNANMSLQPQQRSN